MNNIQITPLNNWIYAKTGTQDADSLREYQLSKLRDTVCYVKDKSRFYGRRLANIVPGKIDDISDISYIPFTTQDMLAGDPLGFVCVPAGDVGRIVTMATSGTAGTVKRIFYTREDQELSVDFFHHGMTSIVSKDDRVLIFLPGEADGSVGNLLKRGLDRFGCAGIVYGPIHDYKDAYHALVQSGATCAVGLPAQLAAIACLGEKIRLKSVLLCSDYVSEAVAHMLEDMWQCDVFRHYGMTETGLGGGVDCQAHEGYHIREADMLFEIIDPYSGSPIRDGGQGEIVFTTLTRMGMPLIRYRTGDISSLITKQCRCGSAIRRLSRIYGRVDDIVTIDGGYKISMPILDEILFGVQGVAGFTAGIRNGPERAVLEITAYAPCGGKVLKKAEERLLEDTRLSEPVSREYLSLVFRSGGDEVLTYGNKKRKIVDKRTENRGRLGGTE